MCNLAASRSVIMNTHNYVSIKSEDTKEGIRSRKSNDILYNGQMEKDRKTRKYLQNITQKTQDWATRT